jgi:hypothetical protein
MTTTAKRLANLAIGDEKRLEAARQRRALADAPMHRVVPALIHPTPELASKKLSTLIHPGSRSGAGLVPHVGKHALAQTFIDLIERYPRGRQWWHSGLRLSDLTEVERRRLVNALVARAPESWRMAGAPDSEGAKA